MIVAGLELTRTVRDALLAQRAAGLRAGVVELRRLADHDRAGADHQHLRSRSVTLVSPHGSRPASVHASSQEVVEEVAVVQRARAGLRVELHRKTGSSRVRSPSTEPSFRLTCATSPTRIAGQRVGVDLEAVVLGRDRDVTAAQVHAQDGCRRGART